MKQNALPGEGSIQVQLTYGYDFLEQLHGARSNLQHFSPNNTALFSLKVDENLHSMHLKLFQALRGDHLGKQNHNKVNTIPILQESVKKPEIMGKKRNEID